MRVGSRSSLQVGYSIFQRCLSDHCNNRFWLNFPNPEVLDSFRALDWLYLSKPTAMLTKLISYLPTPVNQRMRALLAARRKSPFAGMDRKSVFTSIYQNNYWKGEQSLSGTGSDDAQTVRTIHVIENIIKNYKIKSILDVPCGDFHWMKRVNLHGARYIGADIVDDLVQQNRSRYEGGTENGGDVSFRSLDLTCDPLPKVDLVIVRDGFVHLSFADADAAMENIINSNSAYLLATTFPRHGFNYDITTGDWRALNLQKEPFNFPAPMALFNERSHEGLVEYSDKSLGLWKIQDL
jgi:hypothetical protein